MILETAQFFNRIDEAMDDEFMDKSYAELQNKYGSEFNNRRTNILIDTLKETILSIKDTERGSTMNSLYSEALKLQKELKKETKVLELIGNGRSRGVDFLAEVLLNLDDFISKFKALCTEYNILIFDNDNPGPEHFLIIPKESLNNLFNVLKGSFFEQQVIRTHFDFVFCGGVKPEDFKPLIWIGNKETARLLFVKFKNPDTTISKMERDVSRFISYKTENKPLELAKAKKVNSTCNNRMTRLLENLK